MLTAGEKMKPTCPTCNATLDAWTAMEEDTLPQQGDVTVCLYCSEVLEFTGDDLNLCKASAESIAEVMLELSRAQYAVREIRKRKRAALEEK